MRACVCESIYEHDYQLRRNECSNGLDLNGCRTDDTNQHKAKHCRCQCQYKFIDIFIQLNRLSRTHTLNHIGIDVKKLHHCELASRNSLCMRIDMARKCSLAFHDKKKIRKNWRAKKVGNDGWATEGE